MKPGLNWECSEMPKPILTVTDNAAERIRALLADAPPATTGLRLTTPQRGCSGLMYKVDYVDAPGMLDEKVETPGGTLFVDGASLLYLIGSQMDWQEDDFTAGFTFSNPNEKGRCGCGESFTI
jgi:iron-sulfur cluster assembly protein